MADDNVLEEHYAELKVLTRSDILQGQALFRGVKQKKEKKKKKEK